MAKRDNANYDIFWDRQTKKYGVTRYEKFIIHEIIKRNPRRVFEVGIGNGLPIGTALYRKGIDVHGCDISIKLVSSAKRNLGKQADDTCIFVGEVEEYHGGGRYDVIYCARTSWYINNFENTIRKMISMTENGYVIFDIMQKESLYYVKQALLYRRSKILKFLGISSGEHMKLFFYSRYRIEKLLKDNHISFYSHSEIEITKIRDYWNTPKRFYVCKIGGTDMKKGMAAVSGILGFVFGGISAARLTSKSTDKWKTMSDKHLALMLLFNQWMIVKQSGRDIKEYFCKNNYKKIVVYGMSYVGERLLDDLTGADIEVVAAIDKNAKGIFADVPVITPDENMPECDCVVVTAIYFFDEIERLLAEKVSCPIVSLEDILYEV